MSTSLSIKNVPDELVERLKERARRNHRSMQGEVLAILEEMVRPEKLSIEEAHRRIKALGYKTGDESTKWIRELRDAR